MGRYIEMKVGMIVVVLSIQVLASSAAGGCWGRIGSCVNAYSSVSACCPTIRREIKSATECFCAGRNMIKGNASLYSTMTSMLRRCAVPYSYHTLCPDLDYSSSPTIDESSDDTTTPDVPSTSTATSHQSSAQDSTSSNNGGKLNSIIIPIVVVRLVAIIMTVIFVVFLRLRNKKHDAGKPDQNVHGNVQQHNYALQPSAPSIAVPLWNVTDDFMSGR